MNVINNVINIVNADIHAMYKQLFLWLCFLLAIGIVFPLFGQEKEKESYCQLQVKLFDEYGQTLVFGEESHGFAALWKKTLRYVVQFGEFY